MRLIDMFAGFDTGPILVLTGGDPLMRRDLFELARYADESGLRVSLTPTATALPTRERMREARDAGIRRVAFSLDAADPAVHDHFRGFRAHSIARSWHGNALAEELPIQINTTICAHNIDQLERLVPLMESVGVVQWSVFFLVPVGRGKQLEMLTAEQHEEVLGRLFELTERSASTSRRPRRRTTGGSSGSTPAAWRARGSSSPTA